MKKYRIEAQLILAGGMPVTEHLEDAHLTDGVDPNLFALQYAITGKDRLRDLGYTEREIAAARFALHPVRRELVWGGVRSEAL